MPVPATVYLVKPLTETARDWIRENVVDRTTWFGRALAVEHRFLMDLLDGMEADGLVPGVDAVVSAAK